MNFSENSSTCEIFFKLSNSILFSENLVIDFFVLNRCNLNGQFIQNSTLEDDNSSFGLTKLLLVTGSLITFLLFLAIYATFRDFRASKTRSDLLSAFSLKTNIGNLFSFDQSTPPDAIHCFNGLRAISTLSIIYLHSYFFRILQPTDKIVFNDWVQTRAASAVTSLSIIVDSFFVISAALSTRTMLHELDR